MTPSPRLALVVAAWNCERWISRCIESIRAQTYRNFGAVVIDDASNDGTHATAIAAAADDANIRIVQNVDRRYTMANLVAATALAAKDPEDVVIVVDGDDWLKDEGVLAHVASLYADPEVWLTYGSHELFRKPWKDRLLRRTGHVRSVPYPDSTARLNLFRHNPGPYLAGHLRTYRKFLWDGIHDEDLRDDDGEYWKSAADAATMFPMLEMATIKHIRFVPKILYVYNNNHEHSDNRTPNTLWSERPQFVCSLKIRSRPQYAPLQRPTGSASTT